MNDNAERLTTESCADGHPRVWWTKGEGDECPECALMVLQEQVGQRLETILRQLEVLRLEAVNLGKAL